MLRLDATLASRIVRVLALGAIASPSRVAAQPHPPWSPPAEQAAPWSGPAATPTRRAPEPVEPERYGSTPDPVTTHYFQLPSGRPMRHGDSMATLAGYLGWAALRHGFTRRFDAGVGVPVYVAGVSLDARYALVLTESTAVSLWGQVTIPYLLGDARSAGNFLGFTWAGAGPAWVVGPLVSLWGSRLGLHAGVHGAQRVLLGGMWGVVHATAEVRVADGVRAIGQGIMLVEMVNESASGGRGHELVGAVHPRVLPYLISGLRLHSRRFAVDFGLLLALTPDGPLSGAGVGIWPWVSMSQVF